MKRIFCTASLLLLALQSWGVAQQANPVMTAIRANQQRYERNLVGAAETMPAEKYSSKPTDKQMSFGDLVSHVAESNNMLCSAISGRAAPEMQPVSGKSDKTALVDALKASFAFCTTALAAADDSGLGQEVPFFGGRKVTRAAAVLALAADWGDHYSLAATELRLAGLLPPSAQRAAKHP